VVRAVAHVIGELVVTAGVILLLFAAWDLWWTNIAADGTQQQAVQAFAGGLDDTIVAGGTPEGGFGPPAATPVPSGQGEVFGIAYVPRFGADYTRPLVEGTDAAELDTLGLGHYLNTAMPGGLGNFALAGHRQTHGAVLDNIDALRTGDRIYIQTKAGYYTYIYRNTEIVLPNRIDVVLPVPGHEGARPTERLLTMTSCNPRYGDWERIVVHAVLESWRPLKAGPPEAIAHLVAATRKKA
jgi:sortase A